MTTTTTSPENTLTVTTEPDATSAAATTIAVPTVAGPVSSVNTPRTGHTAAWVLGGTAALLVLGAAAGLGIRAYDAAQTTPASDSSELAQLPHGMAAQIATGDAPSHASLGRAATTTIAQTGTPVRYGHNDEHITDPASLVQATGTTSVTGTAAADLRAAHLGTQS
jgi:hypothetical protein